MKYLLDTCVVSELIRTSPNPSVLEWMGKAEEDKLHLSVLTLGEIKKGIMKLEDSEKARGLSAWLEELKQRFDGRILPIDGDVALKWGFLQGNLERQGKQLPSIDALISATALLHGMIVVTRNIKDIERSGVEFFNPWEGRESKLAGDSRVMSDG